MFRILGGIIDSFLSFVISIIVALFLLLLVITYWQIVLSVVVVGAILMWLFGKEQ